MQKILIVEDEIIVALGIKKVLELNNFQVIGIAKSSLEALSFFMLDAPDLILMDINIEGNIDGVSTASEINSRYGTPIIFLTAQHDDVTLKRAKKASPHSFIVKPFNEKDLITNIRFALVARENCPPNPEKELAAEVKIQNFLKNFGNTLKSKRKMMKINQATAAENLAINYRHYQDIEGGKINLKTNTLLKLTNYYNIKLADITTREFQPA